MKHNFKFNIFDFLLFFGISLFPIYVFPSGGLQPSHIFLFTFAILWFLYNGIKVEIWGILFTILVVYIFFVESIYAINTQNNKGIVNFYFLLFNLLIALSISHYVSKNGLNTIFYGVITASLIAIFSAITSGVNLTEFGENGREIGSFNNPNQLGFFSVCLLSLAYLFYYYGKLNYLATVAVFLGSIFLSILSLSKAAMLANFITLFLALKPKLKKRWIALWIIVIFIFLIILVELYFQGYFDKYLFFQRVQGIREEEDSSLESRGYFIFLNGNFIQLIFGLGSYNTMSILGHEVHSSIASILNNYGFFGAFIFIAILFSWGYKIYKTMGFISVICITMPYLLYSITHNGTRFTFFWILFASSIAASKTLLKGRNVKSYLTKDQFI